jgi:sarcosine oxidase subunit beta
VRSRLREELDRLLPVLRYVSLPIVATGMYDMTPDGQPIIDRLDDGLWVAAGFSGHGFMQAPAVGRILAEAILDGREDEALHVLDAARFAENRLVPEPQVV